MNAKFISLFLMGAVATGASAHILSPAEAINRLSDKSPRKAAAAKTPLSQVVTLRNDDGSPELYVMNLSDGSMLLLSAESETPALLGYSDSAYDPANVPPAMQAMLQQFAQEIATLRSSTSAPVATEYVAPKMQAINPICRTTWDQGAPYNYYCPTLNSKKCVTGCVATAVAQVLKALEWPAKCSGGEMGYTWDNGGKQLTLNFSDVTLDWDKMLDTYSSSAVTTQSKAVATLMKALGYATHMNYSPTASGAQGIEMARGLVKYFDYDATLSYLHHDWFSREAWESLIHGELLKGIPVYFDGANADWSSGHAFVVDGYDGEGFFHLNWGWGGMSDGYYRLTALDPVSQGIGGSNMGYNFAQSIIYGLKKGNTTASNKVPPLFYAGTGSDGSCFSPNPTSSALGKYITFNGPIYNGGLNASNQVAYSICLTSVATGEKRYVRGKSTFNPIPSGSGYGALQAVIPSSMAAGTYIVTPAIYDVEMKEFFDVKLPTANAGRVKATIADGQVTLAAMPTPKLAATNLKLHENAYAGSAFNVSATISNPSETPINTVIIPALANASGKVVQNFIPRALDLMPEESLSLTMECNLPAGFATGTYYLYLFSNSDTSTPISAEPLTVNVAAAPASGTLDFVSLKCLDSSLNNLTFEAEVKAVGGYYSAPVIVYIYPKSGTGSALNYFLSQPVMLEAGQSTTVTLNGTFNNGVVDREYTARGGYRNAAANRYESAPKEKDLRFTLTAAEYYNPESGVNSVDAAQTQGEWFDLQGRRVNSPVRGGVYLQRQGGKFVKMTK